MRARKSYLALILWECFCCCLVTKSCRTLFQTTNYSLAGSSVHGKNGLPFPSLGDLPYPGIEPTSELAGEFFTTEPLGKPGPSPFNSHNNSMKQIMLLLCTLCTLRNLSKVTQIDSDSQDLKWIFPWTRGRGMREMVSGWVKHTTFIVHFISIIIPSAPPQIIRHEIPKVGDPRSSSQLSCSTNWLL